MRDIGFKYSKKIPGSFRFLFISLFLILHSAFFSQTYPVQATAQLIAPYSGYLLDYADPSSEKLKIILQFNDFTIAQYNLKLKIEIKGNGFVLSTKTFYNPPPLIVQPGVPLLLSGADLAPYLNSANLDFNGINLSQYEQRMALPEGFYSICVKAYDYYNPNNIQVSNEACTQAWFTYSDPPFLNLPLCNKVVTPQSPQNIIFQWTPLNQGSPNSAANTEYEFGLWECRPDSNANPNQIVLSTAPVFSTTTNLTMLNYGITETPLNLYMKYVWRVRVKDITGRDWFKNNGYSQICTFTYGNALNVLGDALKITLTAQGVTHRLGICTWNMQSLFTKYTLQVRKQGTANWFDYSVTQGTEKITNLEPDNNYEARVRGEGNGVIGEWSNTAPFKTLPEPVYACNDQTQYNEPIQAQPLPVVKAVPGLIIQSGQFEVFVTQIVPNGPAGWYNGKGFAKVLGGKRVAVKFDNIYIDDNSRQQQGTITALTNGIDKWLQQWDVNDARENATYVNDKVDSIYFYNGKICISTIKGIECFEFPDDQNVMVVRDDEGNEWVITPPDKISGPNNYFKPSTDSLAVTDNLKAEFQASDKQLFGFDKREQAAWTEQYEIIKLKNGKYYFVPNKSIGKDKSDDVLATITADNFDAGLLNFRTKDETILSSSNVGNKQFKITGIPSDAVDVYAWYDGKKIGKLNVISLEALNKKLVLVPVNNAQFSLGEEALNSIYKQANVNWTIKTKPNFNFDLGTNGLDATDVTLMSKYSIEMRALRDAYRKADSTYDKEAYYVFVVKNFNDVNQHGYMVRGRAVGFVTQSTTAKEIAHELAHGAFGLEHTFPKVKQNGSSNLLDYSTGITLTKKQWEDVHSNLPIFNWLDGEEDAALMEVTIEGYFSKTKEWQNIVDDLPNEEFDCPCCANSALYKGFAEGLGEGVKDLWSIVEALLDDETYKSLARAIWYLNCCPFTNNSQEAINFRAELGKQLGVTTNSLGTWLNSSYDYSGSDESCYKKGKQIGYALFQVIGTKGIASLTKTGAKEVVSITKSGLQKAKIYGKISRAVSGGKIIAQNANEIKDLLKTDFGKAFFWSGRSNGVGVEAKALEIAKSKGGTTLEGLLAEKNIEMPKFSDNPKIWEDVSAEYANQVSGEVRAVLGNQLRPGNVWENVELKRLKANIKVTKIIVVDPETLTETIIFTRG